MIRFRKSFFVVFLFWFGLAGIGRGSGFHFTVTADPHAGYTSFEQTLEAINTLAGGPGAFHMTAGDLGDWPAVQTNREIIDQYFGKHTLWISCVGNHDSWVAQNMQWLREEYQTGHAGRCALKNYTYQNGPAGSEETTYSFDYGDAHFIVLNIYWNGKDTVGSDAVTAGDIVPELYDWLAADLAANDKPIIFVVGHEPAFPYHRHIGDSLDAFPNHRDAFWALLERYDVIAYFCGHTHYYSKHQGDKDHIGRVWQLNCGYSRDINSSDGIWFFDVQVDSPNVTVKVWNNQGSGFSCVDTVEAVGAIFQVTPQTLAFERDVADPAVITQPLTIRNHTNSAISWSAEETCSWLEVVPPSGVAAPGVTTAEVRVDTTGLVHGSYSCEVTITGESIMDDPRTVTVDLHVSRELAVPLTHPTIQQAIEDAIDGDTIIVSPGTYHENLSFPGKNIRLVSTDPTHTEVVSNTIISAVDADSTITFTGSETDECELSGFTITNGDAFLGGGINGNHCKATLRHCVLRDNGATWGGGIIYFDGLIEDCSIVENTAYTGAGGIANSNGTIRRCLVANNLADKEGGGLEGCNATIVNCTIVNNTIIQGEDGDKKGGGALWCPQATFTNCIIWNNSRPNLMLTSTPNYSCWPEAAGGLGNIADDPLFVDLAGGNVHLKSQGWRWDAWGRPWVQDAMTSPCIDRGHSGMGLGSEPVSIEGDPNPLRVKNVRINMGVFGGTRQASIAPAENVLQADLNNDRRCDLVDVSLLTGYFSCPGEQPGDINHDGMTGIDDYFLVTAQWLSEIE